jgi:hypothetical protein
MKTEIPLVGSGQPAKALALSPQKWTNMFELQANSAMTYYPIPAQDSKVKKQRVAYSTPGTYLFSQLGTLGTIRGMIEYNDNLYVICGNTLYSVGNTGISSSLGTISTTTGFCSVINNGLQLMIDDGSHGYSYTFLTTTLATITDPLYVPCRYITYQEGRAIAFSPGTNQFQVSQLNDFTTWTSPILSTLLSAQKETDPQNLVCPFAINKMLLLFGRWNTEIWDLASGSTSLFPYQPVAGVIIPYGCVSARTVVDINNTAVWLSRNSRGQGVLMSLNGYTFTPLLNDNDQQSIFNLTSLTDTYAWSCQLNNHDYYVLVSPTDNKSFIYDMQTKMFSVLSSWSSIGVDKSGNNIWGQGIHLGNMCAKLTNLIIIGDARGNGNLLVFDPNTYTDYACGPDNSIYREMISPIVAMNKRRISLNSLIVDVESGDSPLMQTQSTGSNLPLLSISLSKDGGRNFGYTRIVSLGYSGQTRTLVKKNMWGQFRDGALKIFTNHPQFLALFDLIAELDIEDAEEQ